MLIIALRTAQLPRETSKNVVMGKGFLGFALFCKTASGILGGLESIINLWAMGFSGLFGSVRWHLEILGVGVYYKSLEIFCVGVGLE